MFKYYNKICFNIIFSLKSNRDMSRRPFALRWQITIRTNATCITTSLTFANSPPHLEHHMVECQYPNLFSTKSSRWENFSDACFGKGMNWTTNVNLYFIDNCFTSTVSGCLCIETVHFRVFITVGIRFIE